MTQSTVWQVARRPRWIAALLLALVIAGLFAALGQWQIGRAVDAAAPDSGVSETILPLADVATPSRSVTATADGQRVEGSSVPVAGGAEILGGRLNGEQPGWWVIARTRTDAADLVLAYGWTADQAQAQSVADRLNSGAERAPEEFTGRPDPPQDVYQGYVVVDEPVAGLEAIDSPARVSDVSLNWLNVFYAIEWVVFAGFALYLWFRLVRDAWEREAEEASDAEERARADRGDRAEASATAP
jgi:surfeit locus 1 family protein